MNSLSIVHRKPQRGQVRGFKVFRRSDAQRGAYTEALLSFEYFPEFYAGGVFHRRVPVPRNRWLRATKGTLFVHRYAPVAGSLPRTMKIVSRPYPKGFHIFASESAAKVWAGTNSAFSVVPVVARGVVARGSAWDGNQDDAIEIIVARELRVP